MTTFRSSALLALAAGPVLAADLTPPSGLPTRLFDVVVEETGGGFAPDAFTEGADQQTGAEGQVVPDGPIDPLGETRPGTGGQLVRFRFVVEGLGGEGGDYDAVAGDFAWLCANLALPALAAEGAAAAEVVIVLADREVEMGAIDPDAVQFFEGFNTSDGTCVPMAF